MDVLILAPKVAQGYLSNLPEVKHNDYKYFNYDNRVVQESVPRGDLKKPYYAPKDFTDGMYDALVKTAFLAVNPILEKYSKKVAYEDALNTVIRSFGNGFFDGKINASAFNVLLEKMLIPSPVPVMSKKKEEKKEKAIDINPIMLRRLKLKREDIPRRGVPRREEMGLVRDKSKIKLKKRGK